MDIAVISRDIKYKELFQKAGEIKTVLHFDTVKGASIDLDAILLDGDLVTSDQFSAVREIYPDIKVFYKPKEINSDVIMRDINRLCGAYKIIVLNEYLTEQQTVDEIVNHITEKQDYLSKRIVSLFGTHSGAGVSTTVLNLARSLGQRIEEKVLVLSLNSWDPSDYFYHYNGHYLNDLKVDLKTKNLTAARLSEAVSFNKNFYHLAGNRDIKMQRFYQPAEIEHLIKVAQELFDVILIDAGTHFDTAPTVQAYLSSNLRFLITNQEEKGYRGYFPYVFQQLIEPSGGKSNDFMLIVNRYQPANTMISEKVLEEELNMTKAATIPDMGDLGAMAAFKKDLLYDIANDSLYNKNLDLLSNLIISECKLTEKLIVQEDKKQKKGLLSFFLNRQVN
ncbi:ParA family protein [Neobacillus notoginsengisoli]|uniref:ParA family protein n=1 Tax=Neobacillus notoginsengisoli TaxID=1578198 RepID=A0A417YQ50_9BACI|nr:ParA family protein [Neobacillus notoginsengisoli]RHW35962.1 ParA family protein [Neobacillus notoginsengisoli]